MKSIYKVFCLIAVLVTVGCTNGRRVPDMPQSPVVVLFESDPHCAVEGYAKMAALKMKEAGQTPYVTVVSSGDFVQGDVIGSVTQGESIVEIMNMVGYDFIAPGNHEFDFGIQRTLEIAKKLQAEELCANFTYSKSGEPVFSPYRIVHYGECDIAFIGLTTPATATSVMPKTFYDESGNLAYSFNMREFIPHVQNWVDKARKEGADYVVILSHLGDVKDEEYPTSEELIRSTSGVDVVLDGHAHNVIPNREVENKEGKPVLMASTGYGFEFIGKLELSVDGKFSSVLLPTDSLETNPEVATFVEEMKKGVMAAGERVVGKIEKDMFALDSIGNWLVRERQMPIGTFCAEAFRTVLGTDIAMINGGGIRNGLKAGDVTYNNLLSVFPFGNTACIVSITGSQLLDALEVSVKLLPGASGSFMQVSGLEYSVDTTVASPVFMDDNGLFLHVAQGVPRRISSVKIYDKSLGRYIPVELEKSYTLGGIDYNLTKLGSDGMFRYTTPLQTNLGLDADILAAFLQRPLL